MKTEAERKAEETANFIVGLVFTVIVVGVAALLLSMFWDLGQLDGYCKAVGGEVEDSMCVKDDTIVKRGEDL